jgi:diaminohydroxyphosphoribosylaminopyrimidine deaminase / 5-amino-6-(5-phosphoribosylamino)uracil reductase
MNYMREALSLALRGKTSVAPNPLVGCVIEREGKIVGSGWHKKAGLPHAEIIALRAAGELAQGANVYVTLEPCCHYGRTPPCVDALIAAKVKSVHIPCLDPNPLVSGGGVAKLEAAGIQVYIGAEAAAAREQNQAFLHYIATKKPYIVAKWAMTLDGNIATDTGDSKWITGVKSREHVHQTRCWLGAVLIGVRTAMTDDPKLTPYLLEDFENRAQEGISNPYRIILDSNGSLPLTAQVLKHPDPERTIIATTAKAPKTWLDTLKAKQIKTIIFPTNINGGVDLDVLLTVLSDMEISGILVEGGQQIFTSFIAKKLINRLHVYIAPKILGSKKAFTAVADLGIAKIVAALKGNIIKLRQIGDDVLLEVDLL